MRVEAYSEALHRADIDAWADAHAARHAPSDAMPVPTRRFPARWLPAHGWIVAGLAAMWLYETDSGVAFLENVIGNPAAEPKARDEALDAIVSEAIGFAERRGFRYVVGASRIPRVLERARRHGFAVTAPIHQIVKELSHE